MFDTTQKMWPERKERSRAQAVIVGKKRSRRHMSSLAFLFLASICSLCISSASAAKTFEHIERDNDGEIYRDYAARSSETIAAHAVNESDGDEDKDDPPAPRKKRARQQRKGGRRVCSANKLNKRCLACERLVKESYGSGDCSPWNYAGFIGKKNCQTLFEACAASRIKLGCRNGRRQYRKCSYENVDISEPYDPDFKYYTVDPNRDPECAPCCDVEKEEFWEAFEAEVVVGCEDGDENIGPSIHISGAFRKYFLAQEECGVFDDGKFDGCYPRNILASNVETIEDGACEDVPPSAPGAGRHLEDKAQASASTKTRRKNKKLKMRGRNQKQGRCRHKCASRSKANDAIGGDPNRRFLRDVIVTRTLDEQGICTAEGRGSIANQFLVADEPPSLVKSLNNVQDKTGFSTVKADVVKVFEYSCDKSSDNSQCNNGSHLCCGLSGCSCDAKPSHESCVRGTEMSDRTYDPCFLSANGALDEENLCCADPTSYAPQCKEKCRFTDSPTDVPTSSPSPLPTFNCELELSYTQAHNVDNDNIDIVLTIANVCPSLGTITDLSMSNCVQCTAETEPNCTSLLSITDIFVAANSESNDIEPYGTRTVQLTAVIDERSRQGEICDYRNYFDYDAIGYVGTGL